MNRVLMALAILVLVGMAFFFGIGNAQAVPTMCGFLAWTPAVWFVGWSMKGAAQGRKIRLVFADTEPDAVLAVRKPAPQVQRARQQDRRQRLQELPDDDQPFNQQNPLDAVRNGNGRTPWQEPR